MEEDTSIMDIELVDAAEKNIKRYAYELFFRAFPDIKDGLKPVHRRILWVFYKNKIYNFIKVASIVGDSLRYHPHGDLAVKDALVRMAQPWVMNHPYIDIQGNMGSQSGDDAAASRYIEAKASDFTKKVIFEDLDLVSVNYIDNYDFEQANRLPGYLPTKIPLILINGSSGIGEAYKCDLPPHNLIDIANICIRYIRNKKITNKELVDGLFPDFPTGGEILNGSEIEEYYKTGKPCTILLRGKAKLDTITNTILLVEFPYGVNIDDITDRIKKLVKDGNMILSGIENVQDNNIYEETDSDVRGKTDKKVSTTYEYTCRKDANMLEILNEMCKNTTFQKTIPINMMMSNDGHPMYVTVLDIVAQWYAIRYDIKQRKHSYAIAQIYPVKHVLEGVLKVYDIIDDVIKLIRTNSDDKDTLISKLHTTFGLTMVQAKGIYEMNVGSLSRFGKADLERRIAKCNEDIEYNENALIHIDDIIIDELEEVKRLFGVERRTKVNMVVEEFVSKKPIISKGSFLYSHGSIGLYDMNGVRNSKNIITGLKPVKILNKNTREITGGSQLVGSPIAFIVCYSNGMINRIEATVFKVANVWYDLQLDNDVMITCAIPIYTEDDIIIAMSSDYKIKRFAVSDIPGRRMVACSDTKIIAISSYDPKGDNRNVIGMDENGHYLLFPIDEIPLVSRNAAGVKTSFGDPDKDGSVYTGKIYLSSCPDEVYESEQVMISCKNNDDENYLVNIPLLSMKIGLRTNKPKPSILSDYRVTSLSVIDIVDQKSTICMIGKSSTSALSASNFKKPEQYKKIFLTVTSSTQI